jgi:hypothetical protein
MAAKRLTPQKPIQAKNRIQGKKRIQGLVLCCACGSPAAGYLPVAGDSQ